MQAAHRTSSYFRFQRVALICFPRGRSFLKFGELSERIEMSKLLIAAILVSGCFISGCASMAGSGASSEDHFADDAAALLKIPAKNLTISNASKGLMSTSFTATTKSGQTYLCMASRSLFMSAPLQCYKSN
jgi:hypothetical protein